MFLSTSLRKVTTSVSMYTCISVKQIFFHHQILLLIEECVTILLDDTNNPLRMVYYVYFSKSNNSFICFCKMLKNFIMV